MLYVCMLFLRMIIKETFIFITIFLFQIVKNKYKIVDPSFFFLYYLLHK